MPMKLSNNFFDQLAFYTLLLFLFSINLSIFVSYVCFTLLLFLFGRKIIIEKKLPILPAYFKYFLIFIGFTLISTIFSQNFLNSLKDNKEIFIFLLIPVVICVLDSRKKLDLSLAVLFVSTLIPAFKGLYMTMKSWRIDTDYRLIGFSSHWMTFSGLLMLVFIFFLVYLFYLRHKKRQILIGSGLAILAVAISFSLTRGAWVGICVAVGAFIVYYKPKILIIAVPLLIVVLIILPQPVKKRIFSIFDLEDVTNRDRIHMVYTSIEIFKKFPLTGVGPNNIKDIYPEYRHPQAEKDNPHLHNNFLQILPERGIFGFLSLLIAFVIIFINLLAKIKNSVQYPKLSALGVLFMYIGFQVMGFFEYNFGDTEIKFMLFYFLSIPFLHFRQTESQDSGV